MSTRDGSAIKEIPVEQLNAEFKKIIRKVLNGNSLPQKCYEEQEFGG